MGIINSLTISLVENMVEKEPDIFPVRFFDHPGL